MSNNNFCDIERCLDYKFKEKKLLETALTHISYSKEFGGESYERLEYLGDAILEAIVSEELYKYYDLPVGKLSKLRASLVSTENLCSIAKKLGLPNFCKFSKSLAQLSKKNTADLFESVLGAVYLDGGAECAKKLVCLLVIVNKANLDIHLKNCEDAKTSLQEKMQADKINFEYILLSSSGLDHEKTFEVGLLINGKQVSIATGKSIRSAEEACARAYLDGE